MLTLFMLIDDQKLTLQKRSKLWCTQSLEAPKQKRVYVCYHSKV